MSGLRYAEQGPTKIAAISKRTTFIALFLPFILIVVEILNKGSIKLLSSIMRPLTDGLILIVVEILDK
jgi:hypothetical protein